MHKIPTIFLRDPDNMSQVAHQINPEAQWLFDNPDSAQATVKKDGTNIKVTVSRDNFGNHYLSVDKRRNPSKKEKTRAEEAGLPIPEPAYVPASPDDPNDKHIFAAVDATDFSEWPEGEWPCEALGPKIQGGVESDTPILYPFSLWPEELDVMPGTYVPIEYDLIREALEDFPIEGIVWHGPGGKMAKIKRRDFGLPWPPERKG